MIYTPKEYAAAFTVGKKKVSAQTITCMCRKGLLPSNHKARRFPKGLWVIEVIEIFRNGKANTPPPV